MPNVYRLCRNLLPVLFVLISLPAVWATHNRAGEISIEQVGDCTQSLTVKATIVTYTKASSRPADRDTLTICWGDGVCERVPRANGPGSPPKGEVLENDTKRNIYIAFHTFPARGTYVISMNDPNRNGGILNVNFPNSDQIRFHIQTTYTFPNPQFQGCNNTPVLLQPPIDIGCVGQVFTHNPNAYDGDGDSLSYHFIVPLQDAGLIVPNYQFPNQINPGPNNRLTINEITGDIVWDTPQKAGEYNLAMIIVEYRQGIPIDTIIRDMQILIEECDNRPPEVETPYDEICVVAGEVLEFDVTATAPLIESNQRVRLTALGGPFEVPVNPATFEPDDDRFLPQPVTKTFRWETACEHISGQYYSVVFKATDNYFQDTSGLATLKTVRIKVVGPPPEDVRAAPGTGQVEVSWAQPYFCEDAAFDYFRGFTVWRRIGSSTFPIDTCTPGLEGRGYERLTNVPVKTLRDGRYVFIDENVDQGRTYCYRILAQFARTTPGGRYTYNVVESLPSEEVCVQLNRDLPLITNVDVVATDPANGSIRVAWSKPRDLDTLTNPGPYRYEVLRATGRTINDADFQPIGVSFESPSFAGANDTVFVDDTGLNTAGSPYSYKINFYVSGRTTPLGATNPASSVFLSIRPTDRRNVLTWAETVPWDNFAYVVFRRNAQGGFDSLATVRTASYTDVGLTNGVEYCYRVRSLGSYGVDDVIDPIINFSQVACGVPVDDVPPCPPVLTVENICDVPNAACSPDNLVNSLKWESPAVICPDDGADVAGYNVYFAPIEGADFQLIASIDRAGRTSYDHQRTDDGSLAGCYAVSAFDGNGNESDLSNIVCVDNCPNYSLPNTFTPNGDGQNDRFIPYPFCFVERVEFKVFNRWGQTVFQTQDPNLNWDGRSSNGEQLADGTYYYVCRIFEQRVSGTVERPDLLSGYIELIRGGGK